MARLSTRDYKRPSPKPGVLGRLREFGLGIVVGAVLTAVLFHYADYHAGHRAPARTQARTHVPAHAADGAANANANATADASASANAIGAQDASDTARTDSRSGTTGTRAASVATHYDFYKMLPRLKVPVPHEDEAHTPPTRATPAPASDRQAAPEDSSADSTAATFLLQVGSYRSGSEAEAVRARLAREGISAQIQRIVDGSHAWHRVRIGPLDKADLEKINARLQAEKIHALVIRVPQ